MLNFKYFVSQNIEMGVQTWAGFQADVQVSSMFVRAIEHYQIENHKQQNIADFRKKYTK